MANEDEKLWEDKLERLWEKINLNKRKFLCLNICFYGKLYRVYWTLV